MRRKLNQSLNVSLSPLRRWESNFRLTTPNSDQNSFKKLLQGSNTTSNLRVNLSKTLLRRNNVSQQPIWELASTTRQSPITEMKQFRRQLMEKTTRQNTPHIEFLKEGFGTVKSRKTRRGTVHEFVNNKREMFLIQMKINEKEETIRQFEEKTIEKKTKLSKVEEKIMADLTQFNDFIDENKATTKEQIKEAENETRERLGIAAKLKDLKEFKTTNLNASLKLFEKLNNLFCFKQFLDKITPASFFDELKARQFGSHFERKSMHGESRSGRHELDTQSNQSKRVKLNTDFEPKDCAETRPRITDRRQSTCRVSQLHRFTLVQHPPEEQNQPDDVDLAFRMLRKFKLDIPPELLQFMKDRGSKYSMYFQNTNDLIDVYRQIEEENVKLIKETQHLKNKIEERESLFSDIQKQYSDEIAGLVRQKSSVIAQSERLTGRLKRTMLRDDSENGRIDEYITCISEKVFELAETLRLRQTDDCMEALALIESCIEKDIVKMESLDKQLLKKAEKAVNDEKRSRHLAELQQKALESSAEKVRKLRMKVMKVHFGRRLQSRSHLQGTKFGKGEIENEAFDVNDPSFNID